MACKSALFMEVFVRIDLNSSPPYPSHRNCILILSQKMPYHLQSLMNQFPAPQVRGNVSHPPGLFAHGYFHPVTRFSLFVE